MALDIEQVWSVLCTNLLSTNDALDRKYATAYVPWYWWVLASNLLSTALRLDKNYAAYFTRRNLASVIFYAIFHRKATFFPV